MSDYVSTVSCSKHKNNTSTACWNRLFDRLCNYLGFTSGVALAPRNAAELFAKSDSANRFRSGPIDGPLNVPTCSMGVTKNGFGIGGAVFVYAPGDRYPLHWGANFCAKTGVPPHTDESSSTPSNAKYQRAWQAVASLAHCTRTLWVFNLVTGKHQHLCYDHYKTWWAWMVATGRFTNEFVDKLSCGGKVDWPPGLVDHATFEAFRLAGSKDHHNLRIVLRSPPPELCTDFCSGKMQPVTVSFLAGSPHAGPKGERGSKAYRHILFDTKPDANGCYISDKTQNPYANKKHIRVRNPLAPGELESLLHQLRVEVDALLRQHASPPDRDLLNKTIAGFEARYVAGTGQPLVMMDGSCHRYFVRRFLMVVFAQPTVAAMRATLWGTLDKEVGDDFDGAQGRYKRQKVE